MAHKRARPIEDLAGRRVGRLSIVDFSHWHTWPNGTRTPFWSIRCDCGTERPMNANSIRSGGSLSCGCLQKEVCGRMAAQRAKPTGTAAFNIVYRNYKERAATKDIEFTLSKEAFREMTQLDCHYCGAPPTRVFKVTRDGLRNYNGDFAGNGIDRLDSRYGYMPGNVLPCCEICNKAKRDLTYSDFVAYLKRLVAFRSNHVS